MRSNNVKTSQVEVKQFELLHDTGARRFGYNWIKINQFIIDVARDYKFDYQKHRCMLSAMALKILINTSPPESKP